ncbi:adenylate/guanylate cyclase domain-containing protein [Ruegeria arenilitoris]|uniref:adenylate/guanylate cyclase domain-containing protein n=1 Tax=Ruegeria arenilitoris TaxID=1173585 RepID=UPI003C7A5925
MPNYSVGFDGVKRSMSLRTFRDEISEEVSSIFSSDFTVEVVETDFVPKPGDAKITFPNTDAKKLSCKLIETCVLYIDIRKSTELNLSHRRATVAKLYSAFGRSITRAARYYGGHVRGIIGDRVMVVFDKEDCFEKAVKTAVLMNSVAEYILNKNFPNNEIKCGIGIDYGKMLITKVGVVRRGEEVSNYKGLVWLGRPANVASKLTDIANKPAETREVPQVRTGFHYPRMNEYNWYEESLEQFIDKLEDIPLSNTLRHKDDYYFAHYKTTRTITEQVKTPPILMTREVFSGYEKACPDAKSIKNGWYKKKAVKIPEYNGDIFGGDVIFTIFDE